MPSKDDFYVGQKVRFTKEYLDGELATCDDPHEVFNLSDIVEIVSITDKETFYSISIEHPEGVRWNLGPDCIKILAKPIILVTEK